MKSYDLHIHSKYSPCSMMDPRRILKVAKKKGLAGIAVADHNSVGGSLAAAKLNRDRSFEVIPSMEITTQFGDILVYYVQDRIKTTDFTEIVDEARAQDAVLSIAHPYRFSSFREEFAKQAQAIEIFNGRTFFWQNEKAKRLAQRLSLAGIAGSDAHFPVEIGNGLTLFDGDLREAIKKRRTRIKFSQSMGPYLAPFSIPIRIMKT